MIVTRFAPSPTGLLHLGHAFSALTAFGTAKRAGGQFLLRIENIDTTRSRPEFEAAIADAARSVEDVTSLPVFRGSPG